MSRSQARSRWSSGDQLECSGISWPGGGMSLMSTEAPPLALSPLPRSWAKGWSCWNAGEAGGLDGQGLCSYCPHLQSPPCPGLSCSLPSLPSGPPGSWRGISTSFGEGSSPWLGSLKSCLSLEAAERPEPSERDGIPLWGPPSSHTPYRAACMVTKLALAFPPLRPSPGH